MFLALVSRQLSSSFLLSTLHARSLKLNTTQQYNTNSSKREQEKFENKSQNPKTQVFHPSNAEMASSAITSFDSLPDELVLKIVKLAAWADFEDEG